MTSKPYRVALLTNPWYECLEDTARLLALGLGCELLLAKPDLYADSLKYLDVILGLHASPTVPIPADAIVYQTEHPSTWAGAYRDAMLSHHTWHYSKHCNLLQEYRGQSYQHAPLGYHPDFPTVVPAENQDIDVLFFGSMSQRRADVLLKCSAKGLTVFRAGLGTFGLELNSLISRSKVVLNVHYYTDPACFEFARVVPLVHSQVCVLSEPGEQGEGEGLAAMAHYDDLADCAEFLCRNSVTRKLVAKSANCFLRQRTMTSILGEVTC